MYEVEVKVRADHEPVRDQLRERGAKPLGAVRQLDTYYDHPDRAFAETDEALRLRREEAAEGGEDRNGGVARLTYKGPLVESASKTREEVETDVGDPEAIDAILGAVGFEAAAEVRKERERFTLSGYTVTLDSVEGAGEFVEIEREGTEGEIGALREGARDLLSDLGLDPTEHVRTSYLELVLEDEGE
ncbi:MAG: class IV adenylate cyclase [Halobacteriales archaeon]